MVTGLPSCTADKCLIVYIISSAKLNYVEVVTSANVDAFKNNVTLCN